MKQGLPATYEPEPIMNKISSKSSVALLAAALLLTSLSSEAAAQETQPAQRSVVGVAIADQGNAALQRIRGELALNLKQNIALPRLNRGTEIASDAAVPAVRPTVLRASLSL